MDRRESQSDLSFEYAEKKRNFLREVFDLTQANRDGEFEFYSSYLNDKLLEDMTLDKFLEEIRDETRLSFHVNQYPNRTIFGIAILSKGSTAQFSLPTTEATHTAINDAMLKCFGYDIARSEGLMIYEYELVSFPDISPHQVGRIRFGDNSVLILEPFAPYGNVEDFRSAGLYRGMLRGCVINRKGHYIKREDEGFWSAGKLTQPQLADYLRATVSVRRVLQDPNDYFGALIRDSNYARRRLEQGVENVFPTKPLNFPDILVGDPSVVLMSLKR